MTLQSQFNKDMLTVAVFTLITVISWTVSEIYHASVTSQITEVQQKLILPLNPKIDETIIKQISQLKK